MHIHKHSFYAAALAALVSLTGCDGILSGIYDEPPAEDVHTIAGQLYVDASDWTQWHYIDLGAVVDSVALDPEFNTSALWKTSAIPLTPQGDPLTVEPAAQSPGIYTYWYDVFGVGISKYEFRSYQPTAQQPEPEKWSFAVHRNNVRTNGGPAAATGLGSLDQLPDDRGYYNNLDFVPDAWNQLDVWTVQDRMLLGIVGNQGINVNPVLSGWLAMEIPPMPPVFKLCSNVFILKLADGSMAALQLQNYQSTTGTKCCLTINYRYPL